MTGVGIFLLVAHLVNLVFGVIFGVASIAGLTGGSYMVVSGVVNLLLWLTFIALTINAVRLAVNGPEDSAFTWGNTLFLIGAFLSFVTGLPLAFLSFVGCGPLFVPGLYHWAGLVATALNFAAYFLLPPISRASSDSEPPITHFIWTPFLMCGLVALVWGLTWLIAYVKLSGSINESAYPGRTSSPLKLPFPGGESSWVIQGNNSGLNHNGTQQFAWDFRRPCGTPVLAARAGTVTQVVDTNDGQGSGHSNNLIAVDHGDGTKAQYLHIFHKSAKVKVGAHVNQGDPLALVGSVGNSLTGHIHFEVDKGGQSVAATFSDVTDDAGIPRTFKSYDSGNRK